MPAATNRAARIMLEPATQPWSKIQCTDMSIKFEPVVAFPIQSHCCPAGRLCHNKMQIPIKSIEVIQMFIWRVPTRPSHMVPKRIEQTPQISKPRPPSRISQLDEFERPYVGESGASYMSTLPSWMLKVKVEDYNDAHKNRYGKRTGLAANRFRYIIL